MRKQGASIILCHEIHETTVYATPGMLDELKVRGQFLTISEMPKLEADSPVTLSTAAPEKKP